MIGYTKLVIEKNAEADASKIGVRLGRACIKKNVPVNTVASYFGVSRATIYSWFSGYKEPRSTKTEEINQFIKTLVE